MSWWPPPLQGCARWRASGARPVLRFPVLRFRLTSAAPGPGCGACSPWVRHMWRRHAPEQAVLCSCMWITFFHAHIITAWSLLLWPVPRPQGPKHSKPSHETGQREASSTTVTALKASPPPFVILIRSLALGVRKLGSRSWGQNKNSLNHQRMLWGQRQVLHPHTSWSGVGKEWYWRDRADTKPDTQGAN